MRITIKLITDSDRAPQAAPTILFTYQFYIFLSPRINRNRDETDKILTFCFFSNFYSFHVFTMINPRFFGI